MKVSPTSCARRFWWASTLAVAAVVGLWNGQVQSAELEEARAMYIMGRYQECIRACKQAIEERESSEEWRLLLTQSLTTVGRYADAFSVIRTNLERYPWSVR